MNINQISHMKQANKLLEYHNLNRDAFCEHLALRAYRAIKWLHRAEDLENDSDMQFIAYWIAFNAAYAREIKLGDSFSEIHSYKSFLDKILELDVSDTIQKIVVSDYHNAIRVLLNNKYIYAPFWEYINDSNNHDWESSFKKKNIQVLENIMNGDMISGLNTIFSRLYTLRNQIVHGGSTWNSSKNRQQLKDANNILSKILPEIIMLMMKNPLEFQDRTNYPPV